MVQLQKELKKVEAAGITVVAISYDKPEILKSFATDKMITFRLLSDKDSKVIDLYKLRNSDVKKGSRQEGIPHPVTVLVNQDGTIQQKLTKSIRQRHTPDELIQAAKKR